MDSKTQRTLFGAGLMVTIILMAAVAGFFYAYQVSVIWGLDAVEPRVAIRAMQGINAEVRNFWFAPSFFGSLVAPIAMLGMAWHGCPADGQMPQSLQALHCFMRRAPSP
jgi:uncharacterized membrane protein